MRSSTRRLYLPALFASLALALTPALTSCSGGEDTAETSAESTVDLSEAEAKADTQGEGNCTFSEDMATAEEAYAEKKGWIADGETIDYMPSQPQAGYELLCGLDDRLEESGFALGPDDADVVVRVFGDFSCPMCTKLHNESMPTLEAMARAGQIRLEWYNFVIYSEEYGSAMDYGSEWPARGGAAAAKQGKFFEYANAVYAATDESSHPVYDEASAEEFAKQVDGLDMGQWKKDMKDTEALDEQIMADIQFSSKELGLEGTPDVFVNAAYVDGAYPSDTIINTVEMQLHLSKNKYWK